MLTSHISHSSSTDYDIVMTVPAKEV
jgi:hypothetical protein